MPSGLRETARRTGDGSVASDPGPLVDETGLAHQVERERMRLHMRGHALTASSGFLPIAYMAWLIHGHVPATQLRWWALALAAVDVVTVAHALLYLRRDRPLEAMYGWRLRQTALQALAGLVWGYTAIWTHLSVEVQTFVPVVLVMVMSIGVIGLVHYHAAVVSFTVSVWVVGGLSSFVLGRGLMWQLMVGVGVVLLTLNLYLWETVRQFDQGLRNRFAADALSHGYQELAETLHDLAITDGLTGLLNRAEGMKQLQAIDDACRTAGARYEVIVVDVDWFKKVNDTYGHLAGDDVLRAVAGRLRSHVRPGDILARFGGEEFLVVGQTGCRVPGASPAVSVEGLAERLGHAIGDEPILTSAGPVDITVSVGVATSDDGPTCTEVFAHADRALYAAKTAGRNRVRHFATIGSVPARR